MERTDLLVGKRANQLRARRLSHQRPDGESRRLPDDRMLWTGTALMRFANFHPSIQFFQMRQNSEGIHTTYLGFTWRTDLR
jgi:hypothetical protein